MVLCLFCYCVLKVARGGSVFKPRRGSTSASVSFIFAFLFLVCYLMFYRYHELLVSAKEVVLVSEFLVGTPHWLV